MRYDGRAKTLEHAVLEQWSAQGRLVPVCPELMGGFATPRPAAEIADAYSGSAVLDGHASVVEETGRDVTDGFIEGAHAVLKIALAERCRFALLTDGSPSCGSSFVYDGAFAGRKHSGEGVTAALLRRNAIDVYSPKRMDALILAVEAFDRSTAE